MIDNEGVQAGQLLAALAEKVRESKAVAVLAEPQFSPRLARVLAEEAGVKMEFLDPDGKPVTHFSDDKELAAKSNFTYDQKFEIQHYHLWSLEDPKLYSLVVQIWDGKKSTSHVPRLLS